MLSFRREPLARAKVSMAGKNEGERLLCYRDRRSLYEVQCKKAARV